jgi:hypothetical protein
MSAIFGLAQMNTTEYDFITRADQQLLYEATNRYIQMQLADIMRVESVFIEMQTEMVKERYQSPGGGRMSRRASGTRGAAVRAYGGWTVEYPLHDYGEQVASDDVEYAYMTPPEYQRHVDTVLIRYVNERRHQILHRLLDDEAGSTEAFIDRRKGTLAIYPLANGDAVTYPPVIGSDSEATEDHYIETNYAATAISDTNNPYITGREELEEHFGTPTGYGAVAAFINNAEVQETEDLKDFDPVEDNFIRSGSDVSLPQNLPNVPGRIVGRTNGVWVVEWRHIPATYQLFIDLEEPAPLKERVDPADTGLPRGLAMVSTDEQYPIVSAEWRARFGLGCGNRLNGVVLELNTGGSYTVPATYD